MVKQPIEKIRDDLFIRKNKKGYDIVYPIRLDTTKSIFAKGNVDKKNLNIVMRKEISAAVTLLIPVIALLIMLVPGAREVKEKCEDNIEYLIENSCSVCAEQNNQGYNWFKVNTTENIKIGE